MNLKPKLDHLGVGMIAVGNKHSNVRWATKFQRGLPWGGEIYIDPTSAAFKAAELPYLTTWQTVSRFFLSLRVISFFRSLTPKYAASDMEGDGSQTGGVFVVGPGAESRLQYAFKESEQDPDVFADPLAILNVCGWTPEMKLPEEKSEPPSDGKKARPRSASLPSAHDHDAPLPRLHHAATISEDGPPSAPAAPAVASPAVASPAASAAAPPAASDSSEPRAPAASSVSS